MHFLGCCINRLGWLSGSQQDLERDLWGPARPQHGGFPSNCGPLSPGSDIIMQLDDVVSSTVTGPRVEEAMYRYVCVQGCVCVCRGRASWSCSLFSLPLTRSLGFTTKVLLQINPLAGPVHSSPSAAGQAEPLCHHPGGAGRGSPSHLP